MQSIVFDEKDKALVNYVQGAYHYAKRRPS